MLLDLESNLKSLDATLITSDIAISIILASTKLKKNLANAIVFTQNVGRGFESRPFRKVW